ncbi:MAG: hypothetical protein WC389_15915 [Lutibacter sp.]|jgi:hypothetical protein
MKSEIELTILKSEMIYLIDKYLELYGNCSIKVNDKGNVEINAEGLQPSDT